MGWAGAWDGWNAQSRESVSELPSWLHRLLLEKLLRRRG